VAASAMSSDEHQGSVSPSRIKRGITENKLIYRYVLVYYMST
jgi:hypothetical protein